MWSVWQGVVKGNLIALDSIVMSVYWPSNSLSLHCYTYRPALSLPLGLVTGYLMASLFRLISQLLHQTTKTCSNLYPFLKVEMNCIWFCFYKQIQMAFHKTTRKSIIFLLTPKPLRECVWSIDLQFAWDAVCRVQRLAWPSEASVWAAHHEMTSCLCRGRKRIM